MPLPNDLPVVDHHCHLSPNGEGVGAARRFSDAGGTHLFLATQNYGTGVPTRLEDYREQYETTERLAHAIERETPVRVATVVAPYPVDLVGAAERIGLPAAVELQERALELAGRWVEEGRAVALGEVGRPHFATSPELREASDRVLRRALAVARDVGAPAVVHSEDLDAAGYRALAALSAQVGLAPDRVVKHYAREVVASEERGGILVSFLARRSTVQAALAQPVPWFLETDFLDDLRRPGAVLDLTTIPRRVEQAARTDPASVERFRVPFVESVARVYGFTPNVDRGGSRR